MHLRTWIAAPLLALIVAVLPARAAEPAPTLLIRAKSLDGIMADAKYVAGLVGQEEAFKQGEGMLQAMIGPKGLGSTGVDTSKPWGLYAILDPETPNSPVVLMIPVAEEKAFVESLNRAAGLIPNVNATITEGGDNVYVVSVPNPLGLEGYFVIDGGYAYMTAGDEKAKTRIAKAKRIPAADLLPPDDKTLLGVTVRLDTIDPTFKQIALGQFENQVAAAKEQKYPKETPAQTKLREQTVDYLAGQVRSLLADGKALDLQLSFDRKSDDISAQFSLSAKPNSPLAKEIATAGTRPSRFAMLNGTASQLALNLAVPEALRAGIAAALDEGFKQEQGRQGDLVKKMMAQRVYDTLAPTLKAGALDICAGFVGPNADGRYTIVGGIKVKDSPAVEQLVRDLTPQIPDPKARDAIAFDAETVGGIKVHKITAYDLDDDAKRIFGASATARFAFPADAFVVAFGAEPADALKQVFDSTGKPGGILSFDASVARLAALDKNAGPAAKKVAAATFGDRPHADMVRVTVEGGSAFKVRASTRALLIAFGAKMADAANKGSE